MENSGAASSAPGGNTPCNELETSSDASMSRRRSLRSSSQATNNQSKVTKVIPVRKINCKKNKTPSTTNLNDSVQSKVKGKINGSKLAKW